VLGDPRRPEAAAFGDREVDSEAFRRSIRSLRSPPPPEAGVERLGWRNGSSGTELSGDYRF
jgi:hypothetical protein